MQDTCFSPDYKQAKIHPSPNFDERAPMATPAMIVMHYTGMKTPQAALQRLTDTQSKVSAHYLVYEDGAIVQMVAEAKRAWHAGESFWCGLRDINSWSIGIEIVNSGPEGDFPAFPNQQIGAVIELAQSIIIRHKIAPRHIVAHSDIAPARKQDPGEKFPWNKLADAGIGHYVKPEPISGGRFMAMGDQGRPVEALQSLLVLYGYDVPIDGNYDEKTQLAVSAFQRHFRPNKVDGIADKSTINTMHRLLGSLPNFRTGFEDFVA